MPSGIETIRDIIKLERARMLLSVGDMTVQQVASELGFYDTAYFCRVFKKAFGITPTQYR
jgi:AraC-like DNA-binding protein